MTDGVSTRSAAAQSRTRPTVSVVIPALNEERNLPHIADGMPACVDEIIFVNGPSVDNTAQVARQLWPTGVHLSQTRKGKGNALACGFKAATGDIVVMIDADGSTNPQEIPRYVDTLIAGADFAKGSRFIRGGGSDDITRFRQAGNRGLNGLVNLLFSTKYTDLCYGYNAFWRDCLDVIRLPDTTSVVPQWGDGFEVETLINVRVAARGLNIVEVSSHEADRVHGTSNLRPISDGIRVLRTISREFFLTRGDRRSSSRRTRQRRGSSVGWSRRAAHGPNPPEDRNHRQLPSHSRIRYIEYECDAHTAEHP